MARPRTLRGALLASRVLASLLAAALLAGGPVGAARAENGAVGTTGEASTTEATETEIAESIPAAELIVAAEVPVLQPGSEDVAFTALLRSTGEQDLPAGTLQLRLAGSRIANAEELTALATAAPADAAPEPGGDTSGMDGSAAPALLAEAPATATKAGEEQRITVSVPRAELGLGAMDEAGVYAVRAELHFAETAAEASGTDPEPEAGATADPEAAAGATLTAAAPFLWRGAGDGRGLPLSVVVPIVLPDEVSGMPTQDQLAEIAPRLDRLLTAAESWSATLAIDPRLIAGIRAYGAKAPASARALLDRLEASALPVFLLQFADADPATQAALGFDELLQPSGLGYLTRLGEFPETVPGEPRGSAEPEADGAADSGGAAEDPAAPDGDADEAESREPDLAELLAWPRAYAGAWPAEGQADVGTLALLQRSGISSLVLASDNLTAAAGPRATVGGLDALIADTALGTAARDSLGAATSTERAAGTSELVARLAFAAGTEEAPAAGLTLALDRGTIADAEEPAALLDALTALDWVAPTRAEDLAVGSATLRDPDRTAAEQRHELLRETVSRSAEIDALSPLLDTPAFLTEYQRVRLLQVFATRYAAPGVDYAGIDAEVRARDDELLSGVRVVTSENAQLVGANTELPLLLHNALPFDARVTLRVIPSNAAIAVEDLRLPGTTVPAEGNATALVPVETRVSSGESALLVQVADAADQETFASGLQRLSIRSSVETILLIALGALALLLLGFGTWRSIRRRRTPSSDATPRAGRDPAPAPPLAVPTPTAPSPPGGGE